MAMLPQDTARGLAATLEPAPAPSKFKAFHEHRAMLAALESGTATADQQRAAFAHLQAVRQQHNRDLREAERDARDAYSEGRSNAAAEARGEPYGTY